MSNEHECQDTCACSHEHEHTDNHKSHKHSHSEGCHCHNKERSELFERMEFLTMILGAAMFLAGILLRRIGAVGDYVLLASLIPLGWVPLVGAIENIKEGEIFDENLLMLIAAIGAVAIKELPEAAAVLLFYRVGEYLQGRAEGSSRRSIAALKDIRPDRANLLVDGQISVVAPAEIEVGAQILVKPGERVPLDGVVINGASTLDTSALTGESLPRDAVAGDEILSGCVNLTGALTVRVTKPLSESTVEKILSLVESAAARKAPTEQFITKFARIYTPVVVALAAIIAIVPPLVLGVEFAGWIKRALTLLVISCPCALVVSVPLAFFGGIGAASKRGILVKGGNYLDALCAVEAVAFDKSGTLTRGEFSVSSIAPAADFTEDSLLQLAAAAESMSTHPIARAIVREGKVRSGEPPSGTDYREIAGRGVSAAINDAAVLSGSRKLLEENGIAVPPLADSDRAIVYIASGGVFAGSITVEDTIRTDAAPAIAELNARGIRTVMLTGDNERTAQATAAQLGIGEIHAELMPEDKLKIVENLAGETSQKGKVLFLGDGINDAPVLAGADIGVAMGGLGSDAALEAADIVLMTDEPSKLCDAINIAKATRVVVMQNIVMSLGFKFAIMVLSVFGLAGMWAAVFADVGVALLAVLNSARIVRMFK